MIIISDSFQQAGKHTEEHDAIRAMGHQLIEGVPLPCGDYIAVNPKVQDVMDRKAKRGIPIKRMDMLGAYKVSVDTKKDIQELISNICGKEHDRFRDECILAQNNGIKLVILVEDDGTCVSKQKGIYNKPVRKIEDLFQWVNPRLFIRTRGGQQAYPTATRGQTLAKACMTMKYKYGVEFRFCGKSETATQIVEILSEDTK